jgi:oligoribonuclease NrnB/cAMP/cGMP phosphodiesterase (DHH superfamily)
MSRMSDRALCFFHRNCLDGRASAAVVHRFEQGAVDLIPYQYGQSRRHSALGRRVWVVDVALPSEEMVRLDKEASEVRWIDHHASNIDLQSQLGWGEVDTSRCGAALVWRHCFPDEELPEVLRYVEDKDLWTWRLPDARLITLGLEDSFTDRDPAPLLDADLDDMRERGRPLWEALQDRVDRAVKHGVVVHEPYGLRGYQALVVNAMNDLNEIGERAYTPKGDGGLGLDLCIAFFLRSDGRWVHSLRSATVDCARLASNRGGGGHPTAASYVADTPFPLGQDCLDWPI